MGRWFMYIRKAGQRGHVSFDWLDSHHSFSFGHYYDPDHMGWGVLRVINDDEIAPGGGFDTHGHRDMEIISYVVEGSIRHRDSMGNESVLRPGEVQRMSAGTGVYHSEFNGSSDSVLKLLQIWIHPNRTGIAPGYEQREIVQQGRLTDLVTATGRGDSLDIHQDVTIQRLVLPDGESIQLSMPEGRMGYLHLVAGQVMDAQIGLLAAADAVGLQAGESLSLTATQPVEALWFDLPGQA